MLVLWKISILHHGIIRSMVPASLPDLDRLDPEELKALVIAKHNESMEQHKELTSSTNQIEHLKLIIEKYRRMIFAARARS